MARIRPSGWLLKSLPPHRRPQADDIAAVIGWGTAAVVSALWLVQPFDWIKEKLFHKPEAEPQPKE